MRRLHKTDGTERHLKTFRYHSRRCREKAESDPLFQDLLEKSEKVRTELRDKKREIEDKEDQFIDATAEADAAELALEDLVRDIGGDLAKADRRNPELNAFQKVLPKNVGGVIDPEGESQLPEIVAFRSRLEEFKALPDVAEVLPTLDTAIATFRLRLEAKKGIDEELTKLFSQEQSLRTAGREQMTSAHARLTDRYKSKPGLADRFFPKDARAGSSARSQAEERGRAQGKIESLLSLLAHKGLALPEEERAKISETTDIAKLDRWFTRALTEATLAAILAA